MRSGRNRSYNNYYLMAASYEKWLKDVKGALDSINMAFDDWQNLWPFSFEREFQRGLTANDAAMRANRFWWQKQNKSLDRDCRKTPGLLARTMDSAQLTKCSKGDDAKKNRLRDYTRRMGSLAQRISSGFPDRLNWEKLLGRYGKSMRWAPMSPVEAHYVEKLARGIYKQGLRGFRIKHCYQNCVRLLFEDDKNLLSYWEGYADSGVRPFQHAWLTINRQVVDPTLDAADRNGIPSPYRTYFGIEIPRKQLLRLLTSGCEGPFITHRRLWQELKPSR